MSARWNGWATRQLSHLPALGKLIMVKLIMVKTSTGSYENTGYVFSTALLTLA